MSVVVGSMVPVAERVCRRVVRTAGNSRYDGLVEAVDRVTAQAPIEPPATTMTMPTTMSGRERSPRRLILRRGVPRWAGSVVAAEAGEPPRLKADRRNAMPAT